MFDGEKVAKGGSKKKKNRRKKSKKMVDWQEKEYGSRKGEEVGWIEGNMRITEKGRS